MKKKQCGTGTHSQGLVLHCTYPRICHFAASAPHEQVVVLRGMSRTPKTTVVRVLNILKSCTQILQQQLYRGPGKTLRNENEMATSA